MRYSFVSAATRSALVGVVAEVREVSFALPPIYLDYLDECGGEVARRVKSWLRRYHNAFLEQKSLFLREAGLRALRNLYACTPKVDDRPNSRLVDLAFNVASADVKSLCSYKPDPLHPALMDSRNLRVVRREDGYYVKFTGLDVEIPVLIAPECYEILRAKVERGEWVTYQLLWDKRRGCWKLIPLVTIEVKWDELRPPFAVIGVDQNMRSFVYTILREDKKLTARDTRFVKLGKLNEELRRMEIGASPKKLREKVYPKQIAMIRIAYGQIAKEIVQKALELRGEGYTPIIAIEDLSSISLKGATESDYVNRWLRSYWAFNKFRQMLLLKCLAGPNPRSPPPDWRVIPLVEVSGPTSSICPYCNARSKPKKWRFKCVNCGYENHRDRVASINIARYALSAIREGRVLPPEPKKTKKARRGRSKAEEIEKASIPEDVEVQIIC